ncbi:MAG: dihydrofolate reductase [Tannerella sp.]|jgi:dihydrofolate reductase|nr:dihydrofolate reductase [Tannerella sp.]
MISIIAAIGENREIGADNGLLWRLPDDMRRFRELTTGHTVIMGRRTFESLPKGALPNRTNVVITGNSSLSLDNCILFNDLSAAIEYFKEESEIFVIGGESIYRQSMAFADKLYITLVRRSFANADKFFPEIHASEWVLTQSEAHESDAKNPFPYVFQTYIKKK